MRLGLTKGWLGRDHPRACGDWPGILMDNLFAGFGPQLPIFPP